MKNGFIKRTVNTKCLDLTYEGKGVCKDSGEVIFVEGMFPGDEGDIEVSYRRGGQLYGTLLKLKTLSPDRINPKCKVATACGGCQFQQYAYKAQLLFKQRTVDEQFRKVGHLEVKALPTLGMEDPYNYRDKIQVPFGLDQKGQVFSGFYKEGTHVIVPITECFIEDKRARRILDVLCQQLTALHIQPYIEELGDGFIRNALIKTSYYEKQIMLVLVTTEESFPKKDELIAALKTQCPEITTLVQNINFEHTNVVLGDETIVLYGPGYIEDQLCGVHFQISAKSFYQTNPVMTEVLYKTAMEYAKLTPEDVVFDAYSGIGTIGLIASKSCKEVISVEIIPEAVQDAIANAKNNGITNFKAYADDASSFISRMAKQGEHIDVLFVDPPRKGCDAKFLDAVAALKPSRIVYISCNPSSLARDVAYISKAYKLGAIQPVDLFPHTSHIETVCALSLRNDDKH
jgi:23S rRNA (uracil1939-C5)-methyltransferase